MPTDSSKSTRRSSRSRKSVDAFILSDINTRKSDHKAQVNVSDNREDSIVPKRKPRSDDTSEILSNLPSVMSTLAYIMQCITLCEQRSIEWHFQKVIYIILLKNLWTL